LDLKEGKKAKKSEMQECKEKELMELLATNDSCVDWKRY
jgi:hypothetical protein